jgi:hypothetical protein
VFVPSPPVADVAGRPLVRRTLDEEMAKLPVPGVSAEI